MAKQVIILVHGMGTHAKGNIKKEYTQAVKDAAKRFNVNDAGFLSKVDLVEFNYSHYLDSIRKQFADNATARTSGFKYLDGKGFASDLVQQLTNFESKFGKDEFYYTHWLDVILYGTMYFGEKIRIDFIKLFEQQRKKHGHKNMHVICHSLGTAVVHDSLAKFYRDESVPFDDIPRSQNREF